MLSICFFYLTSSSEFIFINTAYLYEDMIMQTIIIVIDLKVLFELNQDALR
jgi:hypothetical protein